VPEFLVNVDGFMQVYRMNGKDFKSEWFGVVLGADDWVTGDALWWFLCGFVFTGTVDYGAGRCMVLREQCGKKAVNVIHAGPWGVFRILVEVIGIVGIGVEIEIAVVIESEITVVPDVFGSRVTGVLTGGLLSDFREEIFVLIELSREIVGMERVVWIFEYFMVEGVDLFGLLFDLDLDVLGIDEEDLVEQANQEFIEIFLDWNQLGLILILKQVVLQIYRSFF
jgi:hypothetical protein